MVKRLFKSDDRIFSGVLGGVADYFNIDPALVRVAYSLIFCFTGFIPGIIAYAIASTVIPSRR